VLPPEGVYAAEVILDAATLPAMVNLGRRPTFEPASDAVVLEVHLLDFRGDLYGRELEVCFRHFLRPEQRFADVEALRSQLQRDAAAARTALSC
jgi:riboflavin kinase/FMN adenylyltransferase